MTGWCGQQEAFTYVSVDLGTLHRVKAILVKVRQLKGQPGGWAHHVVSFCGRQHIKHLLAPAA